MKYKAAKKTIPPNVLCSTGPPHDVHQSNVYRFLGAQSSVLLALVFANQHAPNSLSIICQFRIPKPGDNGICSVSFNISDASRHGWDLGWWAGGDLVGWRAGEVGSQLL